MEGVKVHPENTIKPQSQLNPKLYEGMSCPCYPFKAGAYSCTDCVRFDDGGVEEVVIDVEDVSRLTFSVLQGLGMFRDFQLRRLRS